MQEQKVKQITMVCSNQRMFQWARTSRNWETLKLTQQQVNLFSSGPSGQRWHGVEYRGEYPLRIGALVIQWQFLQNDKAPTSVLLTQLITHGLGCSQTKVYNGIVMLTSERRPFTFIKAQLKSLGIHMRAILLTSIMRFLKAACPWNTICWVGWRTRTMGEAGIYLLSP